MINFVCRNTLEVKPPILMDHENDVLYQIFMEVSGQDVKFMRIWLDMFVRMDKKCFEQCGKDYFKTKGLTFLCWDESILDDRKVDVMCLYSLCMLMEVHAWVHLHCSHIWATLNNDRLDHETAMERCAIHLAYLGQGLYVSLHPHKLEIKTIPVQAADTEMDVKPVIIGELTLNKSSTLDKHIKFGLGVGIDRSKVVEIEEEISSDTEPNIDGTELTPTVNADKLFASKNMNQLYTSNKEKFNLKECRVQVVNLKINKRDQFKIMPESLIALLSPKNGHDADSSSDKMIIYWKGEPEDTRVNKNTKDIPSFTI